jgi:Poly (ADP-ribose) glycohydrolase (PARG), Macro domain fold/Poly (ADP-ribose) glycohydrolase (PARG), helical domain
MPYTVRGLASGTGVPESLDELRDLVSRESEAAGAEKQETDDWSLAALERAIEALEEAGNTTGFRFFGEGGVLSSIVAGAQRATELFPEPLPQLDQGSLLRAAARADAQDAGRLGSVRTVSLDAVLTRSLSFTAEEIHCLLCNGFLCTLEHGGVAVGDVHSPHAERRFDGTVFLPHYGALSCKTLFCTSAANPVGPERLKCLLAYFFECSPTQGGVPGGEISFTRLGRDPAVPNGRAWLGLSNVPLREAVFRYGSRIEDSGAPSREAATGGASAGGLLDFANEDLHVGDIWPSATQEEILFSAYPECFVGMLFCETLRDHEAFVVSGARQFCRTEGFTDSFRFAGPPVVAVRDQKACPHVIAIDAAVPASFQAQFAPNAVVREVNKAFVGFSAISFLGVRDGAQRSVSSGHWGCGSFGGDRGVKFVQQLMAAALSDVQLEYHVLGTTRVDEALSNLSRHLVAKNATVGDAYNLLMQFDPTRPNTTADSFRRYCRRFRATESEARGLAAEEQREDEAEEQERNARRKVCKGGCGWDLGDDNPNEYCSQCAKSA